MIHIEDDTKITVSNEHRKALKDLVLELMKYELMDLDNEINKKWWLTNLRKDLDKMTEWWDKLEMEFVKKQEVINNAREGNNEQQRTL